MVIQPRFTRQCACRFTGPTHYGKAWYCKGLKRLSPTELPPEALGFQGVSCLPQADRGTNFQGIAEIGSFSGKDGAANGKKQLGNGQFLGFLGKSNRNYEVYCALLCKITVDKLKTRDYNCQQSEGGN